MTTLFWSERTSKPERQYIGHNHVNPNAIRAGRRGTNENRQVMRIPQSPENGSRDITVFILVWLAVLAVFSFA